MNVCKYQSHPYLMFKSLNVVRISLFLLYYFGHTFRYFFQTLETIFYIVVCGSPSVRNFVFGRTCQNPLMFLHGVTATVRLCYKVPTILLLVNHIFLRGNMVVLMDRDNASNHLHKGTFPQQRQELIPSLSLR